MSSFLTNCQLALKTLSVTSIEVDGSDATADFTVTSFPTYAHGFIEFWYPDRSCSEIDLVFAADLADGIACDSLPDHQLQAIFGCDGTTSPPVVGTIGYRLGSTHFGVNTSSQANAVDPQASIDLCR